MTLPLLYNLQPTKGVALLKKKYNHPSTATLRNGVIFLSHGVINYIRYEIYSALLNIEPEKYQMENLVKAFAIDTARAGNPPLLPYEIGLIYC